MKPVLVLALGNALAGDDGVACEVAARLEREAALAGTIDVHCAGTDLLHAAPLIRGRRRLIIIDATLQADDRPAVEVVPHGSLQAQRGGGAHSLDPVAALQLLRAVDSEIASVDAHWILVGVSSIRLGRGLSVAADRLVPEVIASVAALCRMMAPAV
ncbi:MAG TPA: hydrogenase maturation protease [Longimicrobiales bacterium]|nr:hydrogenase maturation protease [Longimicrobiales bacterium]